MGDPVEVPRSSIQHAKENTNDFVVVDTAGRLGVDEEMMEQARNIRDAVNPDETLFVLDAMVGQDAVITSVAFRAGIHRRRALKLDGDARGGAALSVRGDRHASALSTGEADAFERFHWMDGSRILDMGILTLLSRRKDVVGGTRRRISRRRWSRRFHARRLMKQTRFAKWAP